MPSVVFLRGVNVGRANRCQPALIARQLGRFGVVNIGAVGTFVVREDVDESVLRAAFSKKLPFKCEIMICSARDVIKLVSKAPFSRQHPGPDVTWFVNVLHKPLRNIRLDLPGAANTREKTSALTGLPLSFPSNNDWLLKIIAIQDQFVLGLYRRQMKAIGYLGKIEKLFGTPATTRNWNTIEKVAKILNNV